MDAGELDLKELAESLNDVGLLLRHDEECGTMIISGPAKNTAMMFSLHPRRNRPRPRLVISIVSAFKTKR